MSLSAFETVLEFNAEFKKGLKYVLVPQSANRVLPGSYYDSGSIPDLEAPPEFLGFSPLTTTTNMIATTSLTNTGSSMASPEFVVAAIGTPASSWTAAAAAADSSMRTTTTNNPTLDAMARDVDNALQAARDVVSSSFEIATGYPNDNVVDQTMAQLLDTLAHPAKNFHAADFLPRGAPPGQGLATPLLDYVTSTLHAVRDAPPLFGDGINVVLSTDYETVKYGFQVNGAALHAAREASAAGNRFASYVVENAERSYATNAPAAREHIKTALLANVERIQETNAAVLDKVSANAAALAHGAEQAAALARTVGDTAAGQLRGLHVPEFALASYSLEDLRIRLPAEQFSALQSSLQGVLRTPGWKLTDVVDALNLEELGGWYAGAVVGCLLVAAVNDRQAAVKAATAELTANALKIKEQDALEKQRLEGMVVELTQAVAILTAELRDLKTQRAETNYALASMQNDVRSVKVEVGKNSATEKQLYAKLEESNAKNEVLRTQLETARFEVATLRDVNVSCERNIPLITRLFAPTYRICCLFCEDSPRLTRNDLFYLLCVGCIVSRHGWN